MSAEALALPGVGDIVGEGRFELRSRLGEGGMGTVFLARDRLLDTELALKLLIPRYVGRPEREQRLVNEAEYLRRLRGHEHVVQLIDTGRLRDRNDWPWMSTEIMRGQTLDCLIIRRSLDIAKKLEIARQIAEALAACHEAGVVHRDVNPNNVYVLDDASIKLFDFSHAADLRGPKLAVGAPERLTRVFETPGTVGYIGPEQAANATPDPSMDSFGFGVLLYELVSNSNPYSQYNNRDAFIEAQAKGTLETPRLQAWAYDAPEELAELVYDCMQREGAKRPSAREIVERLEKINVGNRGREEPTATPAANADVTEAVDAPTIIATRRRADTDAIGSWTGPDTRVVPLSREPAPTWTPPTWAAPGPAPAPKPEPEEQTDVLAFARPPQLREDPRSTSAPVVERGPVFARPPEPSGSGRSGDPDPEISSATSAPPANEVESVVESVEEDPAPISPSRARVAVLLAGVGILVTILSWVAYSKIVGPQDDPEEKIEGDRDRSAESPHYPDEPSDSGAPAAEAETGPEYELVAETGGPDEIVPEVEPVEVEPKPKNGNGKPKNGNGKPKNGKPENGKPDPDCEGIEADAQAANADRDWARVAKLTARKGCWASQNERVRLRVNALSNLARFDECIEAGAASKDPKVQAILRLCEAAAGQGESKSP